MMLNYKFYRLGIFISLLFSFANCSKTVSPSASVNFEALLEDFGKEPDYGEKTVVLSDSTSLESLYLTMSDGVQIAVDVYLPDSPRPEEKLPAILIMTRYWRAAERNGVSPSVKKWTRHGYAVVMVDARGTGASFGTRPYELFRGEIKDYGEVVDWIIAQPWSNKRVGTTGGSYLGSTAELLTVNQHPAVKVSSPKFNEFDVYTDIVYPGGVFLESFISMWGDMVTQMDQNDMDGYRVRPVVKDEGIMEAVVRAHQSNGNVYQQAKANPGKGSDNLIPYDSISPFGMRQSIEASGTPLSPWGSWMDAATADGVLKRFNTFSNKQISVVGAWSHGAGHHASPFLPEDTPTSPSQEMQFFQDRKLMDFYLKGLPSMVSETSVMYYYTMGEEAWHLTSTWPPEGHRLVPFYFSGSHNLSELPPDSEGLDIYRVDFEHTTGTQNRWYTQLGGGDVVYTDRAESNEKLLSYTGKPLETPITISGHPVASLKLSSTDTAGIVIVYLEAVAPDGKVLYLTEGHLNLAHRKLSKDKPWNLDIPYHSFKTEDMLPVVPGELMELEFALLPTSVQLQKGYRIRISIAGQDADTFARYPKTGVPELSIYRNPENPSFVALPVIQR